MNRSRSGGLFFSMSFHHLGLSPTSQSAVRRDALVLVKPRVDILIKQSAATSQSENQNQSSDLHSHSHSHILPLDQVSLMPNFLATPAFFSRLALVQGAEYPSTYYQASCGM